MFFFWRYIARLSSHRHLVCVLFFLFFHIFASYFLTVGLEEARGGPKEGRGGGRGREGGRWREGEEDAHDPISSLHVDPESSPTDSSPGHAPQRGPGQDVSAGWGVGRGIGAGQYLG